MLSLAYPIDALHRSSSAELVLQTLVCTKAYAVYSVTSLNREYDLKHHELHVSGITMVE